MSSNDSAMTRFLFAILKQKSLKDIDWNEVARDPILAQPITNGHAARMRYSRFRSSMLGLEPQKRTKGGVTKSKPSKQKKDLSPKQEAIKSEADLDNKFGKLRQGSQQRVKQEHVQTPFQSQFTPGSAASPVPEMSKDSGLRLLTPCSDDMLAETPSLAMSPAGDVLGSATAFSLTHCTHDHGDGQESAHSHENWANSPMYFEAATYDLEHYGVGLCDQHESSHNHSIELHDHDSLLHAHTHTHDHNHEHNHDFAVAAEALLQPAMTGQVPVKSEPWDPQYQ